MFKEGVELNSLEIIFDFPFSSVVFAEILLFNKQIWSFPNNVTLTYYIYEALFQTCTSGALFSIYLILTILLLSAFEKNK